MASDPDIPDHVFMKDNVEEDRSESLVTTLSGNVEEPTEKIHSEEGTERIEGSTAIFKGTWQGGNEEIQLNQKVTAESMLETKDDGTNCSNEEIDASSEKFTGKTIVGLFANPELANYSQNTISSDSTWSARDVEPTDEEKTCRASHLDEVQTHDATIESYERGIYDFTSNNRSDAASTYDLNSEKIYNCQSHETGGKEQEANNDTSVAQLPAHSQEKAVNEYVDEEGNMDQSAQDNGSNESHKAMKEVGGNGKNYEEEDQNFKSTIVSQYANILLEKDEVDKKVGNNNLVPHRPEVVIFEQGRHSLSDNSNNLNVDKETQDSTTLQKNFAVMADESKIGSQNQKELGKTDEILQEQEEQKDRTIKTEAGIQSEVHEFKPNSKEAAKGSEDHAFESNFETETCRASHLDEDQTYNAANDEKLQKSSDGKLNEIISRSITDAPSNFGSNSQSLFEYQSQKTGVMEHEDNNDTLVAQSSAHQQQKAVNQDIDGEEKTDQSNAQDNISNYIDRDIREEKRDEKNYVQQNFKSANLSQNVNIENIPSEKNEEDKKVGTNHLVLHGPEDFGIEEYNHISPEYSQSFKLDKEHPDSATLKREYALTMEESDTGSQNETETLQIGGEILQEETDKNRTIESEEGRRSGDHDFKSSSTEAATGSEDYAFKSSSTEAATGSEDHAYNINPKTQQVKESHVQSLEKKLESGSSSEIMEFNESTSEESDETCEILEAKNGHEEIISVVDVHDLIKKTHSLVEEKTVECRIEGDNIQQEVSVSSEKVEEQAEGSITRDEGDEPDANYETKTETAEKMRDSPYPSLELSISKGKQMGQIEFSTVKNVELNANLISTEIDEEAVAGSECKTKQEHLKFELEGNSDSHKETHEVILPNKTDSQSAMGMTECEESSTELRKLEILISELVIDDIADIENKKDEAKRIVNVSFDKASDDALMQQIHRTEDHPNTDMKNSQTSLIPPSNQETILDNQVVESVTIKPKEVLEIMELDIEHEEQTAEDLPVSQFLMDQILQGYSRSNIDVMHVENDLHEDINKNNNTFEQKTTSYFNPETEIKVDKSRSDINTAEPDNNEKTISLAHKQEEEPYNAIDEAEAEREDVSKFEKEIRNQLLPKEHNVHANNEESPDSTSMKTEAAACIKDKIGVIEPEHFKPIITEEPTGPSGIPTDEKTDMGISQDDTEAFEETERTSSEIFSQDFCNVNNEKENSQEGSLAQEKKLQDIFFASVTVPCAEDANRSLPNESKNDSQSDSHVQPTEREIDLIVEAGEKLFSTEKTSERNIQHAITDGEATYTRKIQIGNTLDGNLDVSVPTKLLIEESTNVREMTEEFHLNLEKTENRFITTQDSVVTETDKVQGSQGSTSNEGTLQAVQHDLDQSVQSLVREDERNPIILRDESENKEAKSMDQVNTYTEKILVNEIENNISVSDSGDSQVHEIQQTIREWEFNKDKSTVEEVLTVLNQKEVSTAKTEKMESQRNSTSEEKTLIKTTMDDEEPKISVREEQNPMILMDEPENTDAKSMGQVKIYTKKNSVNEKNISVGDSGDSQVDEIHQPVKEWEFNKSTPTVEKKFVQKEVSTDKTEKMESQRNSTSEEKTPIKTKKDDEEHKIQKDSTESLQREEIPGPYPKQEQKKNHNILSGIGSKVKHSIFSTVKKAITCSSVKLPK